MGWIDNMHSYRTVTEATIDGKKRNIRIAQNTYNCLASLRERIENESLSLSKESYESAIMTKEGDRSIGFSINDDVSDEKLILMLDYFVATYNILRNKDEKRWMDMYLSFNKKYDYFSSKNEDCIEVDMGKVTLVYISATDHEKYFTITKLALALFMMMEKFYK